MTTQPPDSGSLPPAQATDTPAAAPGQAQQGWPSGQGPQNSRSLPPPMPPEQARGAERTRRRGGGTGTALQILGLGAALFGLLGLPLQTYGKYNDLTFWNLHTLEVINHGHRTFFNGSAQLWFNWGLLIALGVVTVLLALTATLPRPAIAAFTALVALVTIGWQALAMSGTGDFHKWQATYRRSGSMWDHVGSGVWIGLGGLVVVLLGAVLTTLTSRRRV